MRIQATLRLGNYELISRRRMAGYKRQQDLADAMGISACAISNWETFRQLPGKKNMELIANMLDCEIEDIFPPFLKGMEKKLLMTRTKIVDTAELPAHMTGGLLPPGPEEAYELKELQGLTAEAVKNLNEREQAVLTKRFNLDGNGQYTLREIGDEFGITVERIRQIEAKALRKLRHPSRSRDLLEALSQAEKERATPWKYKKEVKDDI